MTGAAPAGRDGRAAQSTGLLQSFLGLLLLFASLAPGNFENEDSGMTMVAARALWRHGDSGLRARDAGAESEAEAYITGLIEGVGDKAPSYGKPGLDGAHRYVWFPMGHVWLMVPFVAAGEALGRAFPQVEERYRALTGPNYVYGSFVFDQGLVALLLPALCGAATALLLFRIARALGCTPREAVVAAAAVVFATQCFPLAREALSDGPGLCFLLAALWATVRVCNGDGARRTLLLGGAAAGAAVLTRYPHALLLPPLALAIATALRRRGELRHLLWFALGGLPCALLFAAVNHARYGSFTDTGYPPYASWFNYPLWFGLTKLLIAAGKGILWFSPLLWLLLPLAAQRANVPRLRWLAWTLFLIPLLLFGQTSGWQSGRCWGARYVTPGVVALLALVLPQCRPWQRWPRGFAALLAAGAFVNVTSLVAPMRGETLLAGQAVMAMYDARHRRGEISDQDWDSVKSEQADHFYFQPRFSPLHANWTYAWRSLTGGFEDELGNLRNGVQYTIEPLFGVTSDV
ncbi:MAG TPA: glycosyltransferase family 39 protein, partial [Burkholderiaceae bacterium]|nr:glycosyltransferase family 39 protein [Burkholderiaceae bacterium]